MIKKYFIFPVFFIQSVVLIAQVGINTETPTTTLEVDGDVLVQQKLYLEDPGDYDGSSNANLLIIKDSDAQVVKYDIVSSNYGPLNQVRFIFNRVNTDGLRGYDTKIDPDKYTIAVHGFSYEAVDANGLNPDTNVPIKSSTSNNVVEGQQFYAAIGGKGSNRSWRLYGFVNNGKFQKSNTGDSRVKISMDVMIYRNEFITKIFPGVQTVDMGGATTGSATLPTDWE